MAEPTLYQQARHDRREPLGSHLGLIVTFNVTLATVAWTAHRQDRLPAKMPWSDVALLGLGAYKVSRLVATERVTEPLRAPFVDATNHEPTGRGLRRALGELVTCPHCVAPWAALGLGSAWVWARDPVRFACGLFGAMTLADLLHRGYSMLQSKQKLASEKAEAGPMYDCPTPRIDEKRLFSTTSNRH